MLQELITSSSAASELLSFKILIEDESFARAELMYSLQVRSPALIENDAVNVLIQIT